MNTNRVETPRGVVLAGGESTRFGAGDDKALVTVGSERCLNSVVRTVRRATSGPATVTVRTADQRARYADILGDGVRFVTDASGYDGPIAGLRAAAGAVDTPWLFCCACDMPLLSAHAIAWLTARLDRERPVEREPLDAVAVEHPDGSLEPLHTLYRRRRVLDVSERLDRSAGPRALLSEFENVRTVSLDAAPNAVGLARSVKNFNTREQLEEIRRNSVVY